jgi:hypothetical protein
MFDRILTCRFLRVCKLWDGSNEYLDFTQGKGIRASRVAAHIKSLEACDDRTPAEDEYLEALRQTHLGA